MKRGALAAVVMVAAVGLGGCNCKSKGKAQGKAGGATAGSPAGATPGAGSAAQPGPAPGGRVVPSPGNGIRPATEPDEGYEARRAELLRRGNPEMMKDTPVETWKAPDVDPQKMIKSLGKDLVQIGNIKLDLAKGRAEIPAKVASPTAPLEYIAVTPTGKAYESLLTIDTSSIELRLALSLMGYEGTTPDADGKVAAPTAADTILLAAIVGGKERPMGAYLIDKRTKKAATDTPWQVIGFRPEGRDTSLLTKDFFTLVERDIFAPLRTTADAGNPYAGPDTGYAGNTKLLPKPGGELTLVLKRRPDAPAMPTIPTPLSPDPAMPQVPITP